MRFRRLPGISEDIEIADHIQVAADCSDRFDGWALLLAPSVSAPVRISPRDHAPPDAVLISYAMRQLWELEAVVDDGRSSRCTRRRDRHGLRLRERCAGSASPRQGAPAVPLRATEGVVGDEGVPSCAWTRRRRLPGVAPPATSHRLVGGPGRRPLGRRSRRPASGRMRRQFGQATGQSSSRPVPQTRRPRSFGTFRSGCLLAVRHALAIPPDTVVRLRRERLPTHARGTSSLWRSRWRDSSSRRSRSTCIGRCGWPCPCWRSGCLASSPLRLSAC